MRFSFVRSVATVVIAAAFATPMRAQDWACSPWETVNPTPFPLRLSAVVHARDQFWGFGATGVAVSRDGLTWQRKSQVTGTLTAALWTGSEFIGTAGNTVLASRDGVTWTTRYEVWQDPIFFTIDLRSIATDGHTYVAVGEDYSGRYYMWSPVLLTSHDGVNWTRPPIPSGSDTSHSSLSAVIWADDRFIAIGTYLLTSPDGDAWTASETISGSSLASDGGTVMVAGDAGLFRSTDLSTWQPLDAPVTGATLAFVDGRFYAAGACRACPDREPSLWSSADGTAWQRASLSAPVALHALASDASRLVAVGDGVAASTDGQSWQTSSAPLAGGLSAIAHDGARVVTVGSAGELATSPDGAAWQRVMWGGSAPLAGVAWGPAGFVAVGDDVVLTSPDGLTWSRHDAPEGASLQMVASNGVAYVAVSRNQDFYASPDGATWSKVDRAAFGGDYQFVSGLVAGGDTFVASLWLRDRGGALAVSHDGLTWQLAATTDSGLPQVAWGGGRFLATDFALVLASSDGTSWQQVSSGIEFETLSWVGDRFVGWSRPDDQFMSSADGASWQPIDGPTPPGGSTLAVSSTLWRVGGDAAIRRSVCGARSTIADLPGLAHLAGARSTVWRSDAEFVNPGTAPITVGLVATPRDEIAAAGQESITLRPGEARRIDDVLASELGVEDAATVRLSSWGGPVLAAARTFDDTPAGTLGQLIPPFLPVFALTGGWDARLLGLAHAADASGGFRTNVGLVNDAASSTDVDVDLFRADGLLVGSLSRTLRGGESVQINDAFGQAGAGDVPDGFAVVRAAQPDARVAVYASVVDNVSGDPTFVPPARAFLAGAKAWLPGAGHLAGLNGSVWRTDLDLHNPGSQAALCRVELFPWNEETTTPAAIETTIPAGGSVRLEDVVKRSFGRQRGASLRLTALGGPVMASARTFTTAGEGSLGQTVEPMFDSGAITPDAPRRLIMLRQSASGSTGYRSNLGLVNTTATPATATIELHDAAGARLGTITQPLRAFESLQLTEVLGRVTTAEVRDAWALVSTDTPGAALHAYVCLIDNRTNDPLLIPAQ